ncbi:MAG: hypothetical protein AB7W16_08255 [Candidatus Obscuribacterales bacterium]
MKKESKESQLALLETAGLYRQAKSMESQLDRDLESTKQALDSARRAVYKARIEVAGVYALYLEVKQKAMQLRLQEEQALAAWSESREVRHSASQHLFDMATSGDVQAILKAALRYGKLIGSAGDDIGRLNAINRDRLKAQEELARLRESHRVSVRARRDAILERDRLRSVFNCLEERLAEKTRIVILAGQDLERAARTLVE